MFNAAAPSAYGSGLALPCVRCRVNTSPVVSYPSVGLKAMEELSRERNKRCKAGLVTVKRLERLSTCVNKYAC